MNSKVVTQVVDSDGKPSAAEHDPHWFLTGRTEIRVDNPDGVMPPARLPAWADVFSRPQRGNKVEFHVGGAAYFEKVAQAISSAKESVFITGWQVNYAVELAAGKKLLQCLEEALDNGASIYVMPWLAPPSPIDTGYFPTMLAVAHLNAGRGQSQARAYCMPAMVQSDQNKLSAFFSHHQKLVVIDNEQAFVGGIDLAYGRREDARYTLKADGRSLDEFYSHCVPGIKSLTRVERQDCVTPAELIAAGLMSGATRTGSTFLAAPAEGAWAKGLDGVDRVGEVVGDAADAVVDFWNNVSLFPDFVEKLRDNAVDQIQDGTQWAWSKLEAPFREQLERLYQSGTANAVNVGAAVTAWMMGADMSRLPASLVSGVSDAIQAIVASLVSALNAEIASKPRYDRLFEKMTQMPGSALVPDPDVQPRQPWHDVHCSIKGPSVHDLSTNFVNRWNATAKTYRDKYSTYRSNRYVNEILKALGVTLPAAAQIPSIAASHLPQRMAAAGSNWVQVIRSAPSTLLRAEAAAGGKGGARAQNNCLMAMLQAIGSAQNFLYIEGQFYQTSHEYPNRVEDREWSGGMSSQMSIWNLRGYAKFAEMLNINGKPIQDITPNSIRWSQVDNVLREPGGPAFMNDVYKILENWATVQAVNRLEAPQEELLNPVGKALVGRIERAIDDGLPFHVYLVVPVHPEGLLDDLMVMSQIDHTMRSLVFGDYSLVNGVRRALVAAELCKTQKLTKAEASAQVRSMRAVDLEKMEAGKRWPDYLTLLNLRNWDTIGGRPVTEQIYVHSKLLIADDRVAVLGSANINDRSLWGDRDSELAVIVTDETPKTVKLDGVRSVRVGASVQALRRGLWEAIFGLRGGGRPASALNSDTVLDSPAAPATWLAIQRIAAANAAAYEQAFPFIPRDQAHPDVESQQTFGSVWPTWRYPHSGKLTGGTLVYRMPFDPAFWRSPDPDDTAHTWNLPNDTLGRATEATPSDIQGFITALPIEWTGGVENNNSTMSLTVLANNDLPIDRSVQMAMRQQTQEEEAVG